MYPNLKLNLFQKQWKNNKLNIKNYNFLPIICKYKIMEKQKKLLEDITKTIDALRKQAVNKSCFDCGEKVYLN